jgi:thioester reductase-like protein
MQHIVQEFKKCLADHPEQLLYVFLDKQGKIKESYTYRAFDERTYSIAQLLQQKKSLVKGDRVLLAYPPGLEMICAFFACARIGLIPVPVYPPANQGFFSSLQKMNFIALDCGAKAVLTDRTYYWSMQINLTRKKLASFSFKSEAVAGLDWIVSSDARVKSGLELKEDGSDILFIQYTSGSTNHPKGVMVSHENIIYNGQTVVDHKPIGVSWLPQYHDMGLIGYYLFFAMKGGTTYGFSPLDFIQRPALWFETITKYKGTASSAPNFAYEYCLRPGKITDEELATYDLSSLQFLMTAAEPIRKHTYDSFVQKFSCCGLQPQSYFGAYGLAEFSLAVSNYGRKSVHLDADALARHVVLPVDEKSEKPFHTFMSCGTILGDTQVKIVNIQNEPKTAAENEVGEIWLDGRSKCVGYWNQPELSESQFHAKLAGESRTWLRTGDLGFIMDGELFISGRSKDMIIVRGLNYYPHDIELLVEQHKQIRKGCSAAFYMEENGREKLIVVAELKSGGELTDVTEINQRIQQYLGILVDEFVFIKARTISKTSSGKIMRSNMKQRYLSRDLELLSRVEIQDTRSDESFSKVIAEGAASADAFTQLFHKYELTGSESESLADLGFDSMKLAEFAHDLKETISGEGFDELSAEIDLRLLQKIAMSELFELVQGLNQAAPQAKFRFKSAFQRIHKEFSQLEQEMMRTDAAYDVAKELEWNPSKSTAGGKDIFLTGATGFFGPFLLKSLLEQSNQDLQILVRADAEDKAMERLRQAFETIRPSAELWNLFDQRVHVVLGDLSKAAFGLSPAAWSKLDEEVNCIYHNGAIVNYLLDYESMRAINVDGTNEVLRLAMGKVQKELNHISTTFIFGWSVKDTLYETDQNAEMERLDFGYSQSKWVSEQLVFNAMKHGLKARVFRPALISPSIHGEGYNFDISIRLLAFMLKHGIGTLAQNQVSFTPANLGAHNIVAICQESDSLGLTFHVTRDQYASMGDITQILGQLTGKAFQAFSLKDFVPEVVGRCQKDDLLFPLLNFLVKSVDNISSMEFKLYSNANYRKFRQASPHGVEDPSLSEVVQGILTFMLNHHIVSIEKKI